VQRLKSHAYLDILTHVCKHYEQNIIQVVRCYNVLIWQKGAKLCDHCGKNCKHVDALKQNIQIDAGERLYSCDDCTRRFYVVSSSKKVIHLQRMSGAVLAVWAIEEAHVFIWD
jgi:hypothetical protein